MLSPGYVSATGSIENVNPNCKEGVSRPYSGGPYIEYQTIQVLSAAQSNVVSRDLNLFFTRPYKMVGVASVGWTFKGSSVFLHFQPLNLPVNGSNAILPTGSEQWFPLNDSQNDPAAVTMVGRFIIFNKPVQQLYVDADHPAGVQAGGYPITFFATNDVKRAVLSRS